MNEYSFEKIDALFAPEFIRSDFAKKPLLIIFSGVPTSGKSTLTQQLAEQFGAIAIRKQDIWDVAVQRLYPNLSLEDRNVILNRYAWEKINQLADENALLIFDSSVDRKYSDVEAWLADHPQYNKFLVHLKLAESDFEKRVRAREETQDAAEAFLKEKERYFAEHREFLERYGDEIDFEYDQENIDLLFDTLGGVFK